MIGQTISHYRILEELGGGGMGVVYKAEDTKLKRTVALKFLPSDLTRDRNAKTRFIQEARAASALQHNNICTIHEIDETNDGRLFIAMDCYEGETLKQRIARGPLPVDDAIDIASQAAEGLAKAHEAGMVHRDIKPANIMITSDGVVKIVDFGLAKLAGQTKLTKTGTTLGTVSYMSPEQATGEEVENRSDIWSLGVVLYEMLTGEVPFKGDHEAAVLYGIINSEPRDLATCRSGLPGEVQRIVRKAMAKDRNNRFQSVSELADALDAVGQYGAGTKTDRRRSTWRIRTEASKTRRPWILAAAAAIVVLGSFAIYHFSKSGSSISAADAAIAVVDFSNAASPDDHVLATGITGLIQVGLVESSPIRVVSTTFLQDLRRRRFGEERGPIAEGQAMEVARESGATVLLTGQIVSFGEDRYVAWQLQETGSGRSLAAKRTSAGNPALIADEIVADVVKVLARSTGLEKPGTQVSVSEITTDSPEAYEKYVEGTLAIENQRFSDAARQFELAIQLDSTFALAYQRLSFVHSGIGRGAPDYGAARIYADKAWEFRSHLGIKDRMHLEAWRYVLDSRANEAITTYREMLARWPDDQQIIGMISATMFFAGHLDECIEICRKNLLLYPEDITLLWACANSLAVLGRSEEAIDMEKAIIRLNPGATAKWAELGQFYLEMAEPDSAEVALQRALEIAPENFFAMRYLSYCAYYRGEVQRAIEIQEALLERHDLLAGERIRILAGHPATMDLPSLYAERGNFDKAIALFEQALSHASDYSTRLMIESRRGKLLLRRGRAEEALVRVRDLVEASGIGHLTRLEPLECIGRALVDLDSLDAARSVVLELQQFTARSGRFQERVSALRITGAIALAEGNPDAALNALREVDRLGMYRGAGPDNIEWREAVARAHRIAGRLDEAARVHEEILRTIRGHTLSHYDLGLIYEEMGRPGDAEREYKAFLSAWSEADEGLPQLVDARKRLATL